MEFSVLIEKMVTFLVLMAIGYVLNRRGVLDGKATRVISSLTFNVFMVGSIIASAMNMDTPIGPAELGQLLVVVFVMQILGYVIAAIAARVLPVDKEREPVFELLMSLGNTIFIALPIVDGIYGARGAFYVAVSCIPFNVLIYSYGVLRLKSGSGDRRLHLKEIFTMPLLATLVSLLLILLRLPVPGVLRGLVNSISGATMPLSMLVIGASLGSVNFFEAFKRGQLYIASFIRLIVIPLLTWLVLRFFVSDPVLLMSMVIVAASPAAVLVTVLSIQYKRDAVYAAEGVLQSTLLCMLTIPLLVRLLG